MLSDVTMWRVVGEDRRYEVSDLGQVRSAETKKPVRTVKATNGYILLPTRVLRKSKNYLLHRLIAKAFIPNHSNLSDVDHIDNCKSNNAASNLQWLSHADNMKKAKTDGAMAFGSKRPNAVLDEAKVFEIKKRLAADDLLSKIANDFGVSIWVVNAIRRGKTWAHVHGDEEAIRANIRPQKHNRLVGAIIKKRQCRLRHNLSRQQLDDIVNKHSSGISMRKIAEEYWPGIASARKRVSRILKRKNVK
jgi:HNH endonuclease